MSLFSKEKNLSDINNYGCTFYICMLTDVSMMVDKEKNDVLISFIVKYFEEEKLCFWTDYLHYIGRIFYFKCLQIYSGAQLR